MASNGLVPNETKKRGTAFCECVFFFSLNHKKKKWKTKQRKQASGKDKLEKNSLDAHHRD